jgi:hypothetical protein
MMSVNTLGEVPDADGYIIELGMEGTNHPAASLEEDRIRDEMDLGEWYVRTSDPTEEQELMSQINKQVDHTKLPAYLVLGSHPKEATDAVIIYLDEVDTAKKAWEVLERAIFALREPSKDDDGIDMSEYVDHLDRQKAWIAINAGSVAIQYITFAGIA